MFFVFLFWQTGVFSGRRGPVGELARLQRSVDSDFESSSEGPEEPFLGQRS